MTRRPHDMLPICPAVPDHRHLMLTAPLPPQGTTTADQTSTPGTALGHTRVSTQATFASCPA